MMTIDPSPPSGERLDLLYRLSQTFSSSLDLDQVLNRVMDEVIAATGAERGFVMLRESDGRLRFRAARGIDRETIDHPEFQISRSVVEWVADEGQPILTRDAQTDDQFGVRQSVRTLGLRSIMCVPLRIKDQVSGVMYVDNRVQAGLFLPADLDLLAAIASSAAIAIENARLHQERLAIMRQQLAQVTAAQEEERRRIARELHDGVGPALASMSHRLRALLELLAGEDRTPTPTAVGAATAEIEELAGLAADYVRDIRRLIYDLRPAALDELGLVPALRHHLLRRQQEQGLAIGFCADSEARLPAPVETALFRIAQEAANNAIKHAGAQAVDVRLVRDRGGVRLTVADDGQGFDPQAPRASSQIGLWSMRERVEQIGGEFELQSAPGQGTTLSAWVPLDEEANDLWTRSAS
jgi:signal transduction histidine kinase